MEKRLVVFAFAMLFLAGLACRTSASFAAQDHGEWLLGWWDGSLDTSENQPLNGPDRTLIVTGVASDAKATGVWGISGKSLHRVEITLDGPQLRLITPASSIVALRHREDDQMDGVLTSKDGKTFAVVFAKRDQTISPPAERHPGEWLIGKWEGGLETRVGQPLEGEERTLIVTGVGPDGMAEGVWGLPGRPFYKAQIKLEGSQLEGVLTSKDGRAFLVGFSKRDSIITPVVERNPGEALIGEWGGALDDPVGTRMGMTVTGVASDGNVQGVWGPLGKPFYKAQIKLQGSQLNVITIVDNVAALNRTSADELEGLFTLKDGRTFPIRLSKKNGRVTSGAARNQADWVIGKWEGAAEVSSDKGVAGVTLKVTWVGADGTVRGVWGRPGEKPQKAEITLQGSQVKVITAGEADLANTVVELTRKGNDQLAGVFTAKNGIALPLTLTKKASTITLVYVSAVDCKYCDQFNAGWANSLLSSPEGKRISYRKVRTGTFYNTHDEKDWPDDLKWLIKKTNVYSGAPRFIVAVDDQVVLNVMGLRVWDYQVVPLVKQLVAQSVH